MKNCSLSSLASFNCLFHDSVFLPHEIFISGCAIGLVFINCLILWLELKLLALIYANKLLLHFVVFTCHAFDKLLCCSIPIYCPSSLNIFLISLLRHLSCTEVGNDQTRWKEVDRGCICILNLSSTVDQHPINCSRAFASADP